MRSFLGLPLSVHTVAALSDLQRGLRVGRPVAQDNLHVTLAFLDDQTDDALEELHGELQALRAKTFELTLRGAGCFGGADPRAVFIGVESVPALVDLHCGVTKAIRRAGLTRTRRRFFPHVTIARLKPQDAPVIAPFVERSLGFHYENGPIREFVLFQSVLRPTGAEYHALAQYPLV